MQVTDLSTNNEGKSSTLLPLEEDSNICTSIIEMWTRAEIAVLSRIYHNINIFFARSYFRSDFASVCTRQETRSLIERKSIHIAAKMIS